LPEIASVRSGIGSAKTRWRGELPEVHDPRVHPDPEHPEKEPEADHEDVEEVVAKAAPSWLLSLVMHLIVLLILALISTPAGKGLTTMVLEFGVSEEANDVVADLDLVSTEIADSVDITSDSMEEALEETEIPDVFETIEPTDMEAIEPVVVGSEAIEVSTPMFSGRTGAMRQALMAMYGATDETREAVKLGLEWLKRQQHRSGYWSLRRPFSNGASTDNKCAATAMALIAFAGDGNTHLQGPYRREVEKGLKFLVAQQDRGGYMAEESRGHDKGYAQAQATIALCELYAMTKDSWLRGYAQQAIDFTFKAQGPNGGWRYRPGEPGDTSVTGWYVMAIQSAIAGGLEVNDSKVRMISDYLDSASVYNGAGYAYLPGQSNATPTMTAEGLLCRQYLGWEKGNPALIDGVRLLEADGPFDIRNHNVYYWYYATQVLHHFGGAEWRRWNDVMKVKLPALQVKRGAERGSWAPQRDRYSIGGRLYTTCLSIYCLEVYYRHLPLYDQ
jgi:hypothetical protein